MIIRRLEISDVRNIRHSQLLDLSPINVFYGENGSGKTTLLESIYMLSSARSFRSHKLKPVINVNAQQCVVFGEIASLDTAYYHSVGVLRSHKGDDAIKIDGSVVRSASQLAEILPVQVINSESFMLLDGGPLVRRQFLDWGVFHVEHTFHSVWKSFQRCLKQRNSLLRHGRIDDPTLAVWTNEFIKLSEQLDGFRRDYLDAFYPVFEMCLAKLIDLGGIELRYQRGWAKEADLKELLTEQENKELEQGHTLSGPHRADIKIRYQGQNAADILSRGQQKLMVCAMRIAQGYLLSELTQRRCVFLVDDLPSELDENHRQTMCNLLEDLKCQVFISCVDHRDLENCWKTKENVKKFHVEQGVVSVVNM